MKFYDEWGDVVFLKDLAQNFYDPKEMVDAYFHGDLNLEKLFELLGKDEILKVLYKVAPWDR
jgi:hypothetical protein